MTVTTKILTEELQKAYAAQKRARGRRVKHALKGNNHISPAVDNYLKQMSDYRARAKTVRVGSY